jgi:transposase
MIPYHLFDQIQTLRGQGYSARKIARALQLNPKTVRAWFKKSVYRLRRSARRASRLDPFKPQVIRLLDQHHFTAQQIFQKIRESGFQGKYPSVKKYVRNIRPPKPPAFLTLAFAPGECAQLDWGEYGTIMVDNTLRKLYFF